MFTPVFYKKLAPIALGLVANKCPRAGRVPRKAQSGRTPVIVMGCK